MECLNLILLSEVFHLAWSKGRIIAFGTFTFGNIAFGTVTFGNIVFGTVTFGNIVFGTVTFGNIAFGTVKFGNNIFCGKEGYQCVNFWFGDVCMSYWVCVVSEFLCPPRGLSKP